MQNRYYDEKLGIDGTAEELARFGTQYADDYSDEGLGKIIEILQKENMKEQASRVAYELESRQGLRDNTRDLGRIKLWVMDGMHQLVDEEDNGAFYLNVICENDQVVISVTGKPEEDGTVRENAVSVCLNEFYAWTAKEFDEHVNSAWFYAQ